MKVVAFDVGVKNLAFVAMTGECRVTAWENLAVAGESLEENVRAVHTLLLARPAFLEHIDVVLIERQPPLNRRMSCLAFALFMFFLGRAPRVLFVDPKTKTSAFAAFLASGAVPPAATPPTKSNAYRRRKAESVACARHALAGTPWLQFLDSAPKRDDLADSLLHAYSWVRSQPLQL